MHELVKPWADDEGLLVANELGRLFMFHGFHLGKGDIAAWCTELQNSGLPSSAVLAGLKKLQNEDLKRIRLWNILDAAKECIFTVDESPSVRCERCDNSGSISMRTSPENGTYWHSFACLCKAGQNFARATNSAVWNGRMNQARLRNGKTVEFELCHPDILSRSMPLSVHE